MQAKDFNFDRYLRYREEKEAFLKKFLSGEYRGPVLTQRTCSEVFGVSANSKEASLEDWLNVLDFNMQLKGDVGFTYLEPWAGVPVYANAFGSPLFWTEITDVQSKPRYLFADEVANVPMPKAGECQMMQMVLDYIRYFKEQTHGLIPISLTDTQSPNDTASLILDPCELFAVSLEEPEALTDFMTKITQTIGDFSEMQIDAIGEDLYVAPGHMMLSGSGLKGIALSDDNMAVVSPASYEVIGKPYNEMLSRRFGGLALHSCGVISHNIPLLLQTEGLGMLDFKITDFEPNDAALLAEKFAGTGIVLKACVYPHESMERLLPLMRSDVKTVFHLFTSGTPDECNRQYDQVAQFVHDHYQYV